MQHRRFSPDLFHAMAYVLTAVIHELGHQIEDLIGVRRIGQGRIGLRKHGRSYPPQMTAQATSVSQKRPAATRFVLSSWQKNVRRVALHSSRTPLDAVADLV